MDFIVVSMEYAPTPDPAVLAWADGLLTTYANRRAIVISHSIIGTGNPAGFGSQGQAIYDALKSHANLFLMLGGHVPGEGRRQDTFSGHTVYTLLSDYQGRTNGGNGWLRIMQFSPANNVIRVRTYSPWLSQYEADADSSSQFTLFYDMSGAAGYQLIGTVTDVPSGSHATLSWPGLAAGTQYEWYATVSDGTATTPEGTTWKFTTGGAAAPPDPVSDLAVSAPTSGNDTDGTLRVNVHWTPPAQAGTAQVYRKAFGDYPLYRDGVGHAPTAPATPAAAVSEGWTLVPAVTAPDQTDEVATRDQWSYVVFTVGTGGASAASNLSSALNYFLGDVSDGLTACAGDNTVDLGDVSLLGAHYGALATGTPSLECQDVGPTLDGAVTSRPTPDGHLDFEDLVCFALNYGLGEAPPATAQPVARAHPTAAAADAIALETAATPGVGGTFDARIMLSGTGRIAALGTRLAWDPAVVEPVSAEGGALLAMQAVRSIALSPAPGSVDVALLGRGGMFGGGEIARVRFRVLAAGDPGIRIADVRARDASNRAVTIARSGRSAGTPSRSELRPAAPNPFTGTTTLSYAMAKAGPAELAVYSVDGRRVRTLFTGNREAGEYRLTWDGTTAAGTRAPAGVYFVRLTLGAARMSRTVMLVR